MTENNTNTGRIRKKQNPFSQVSNHPLRNPDLSLKAKGLYSLIQSYINIPNFALYKGTLMNMCQEGDSAFNSAWKELKKAGYLIQIKKSNEQGHFIYEYELLDIPDVCSPEVENPHMVNPEMEKPYSGKTQDKNIYNSRNNESKINNTFIQSNLQNNMNDRMSEINISSAEEAILNNCQLDKFSYFDYIEFVKKQIDFEKIKPFAFYAAEDNREQATMEWVRLMADIYSSTDQYLQIGKQCYNMSHVKQKLMLVDWSQMIGIFSNFTKLSSERTIRNPKNYMITALLNAHSSSGLTAMAVEDVGF